MPMENYDTLQICSRTALARVLETRQPKYICNSVWVTLP